MPSEASSATPSAAPSASSTSSYTATTAASPNQQVAERWEQLGILLATPSGTNDDWYWLFAAMCLPGNWHVVTNDQLKDHHLQMLSPEALTQWRERHVINFFFRSVGDVMRPFYSAPTTHTYRMHRDLTEPVLERVFGAESVPAPASLASGGDGAAEENHDEAAGLPDEYGSPEDALRCHPPSLAGCGWHVPFPREPESAEESADTGAGAAAPAVGEKRLPERWLCIQASLRGEASE